MNKQSKWLWIENQNNKSLKMDILRELLNRVLKTFRFEIKNFRIILTSNAAT